MKWVNCDQTKGRSFTGLTFEFWSNYDCRYTAGTCQYYTDPNTEFVLGVGPHAYLQTGSDCPYKCNNIYPDWYESYKVQCGCENGDSDGNVHCKLKVCKKKTYDSGCDHYEYSDVPNKRSCKDL